MPKKALSTVYRGTRADYSEKTLSPALVTVDGKRLDPRPSQRMRNHSPDGFEWGYAGSGPAQLALAILLDYFGQNTEELHYYQDFKFHTIARFASHQPWELNGAGIELAMRELMAADSGTVGELRKAFR